MSSYRKIYERCYGPIPKGWHVHHKDGDRRNNNPSNLIALTVSEHQRIHYAAGDRKASAAFIAAAFRGGRNGGIKSTKEKLGFHAPEHRAAANEAGRQNGIDNRKFQRGICSPEWIHSKEKSALSRRNGKKNGRRAVKSKTGIHNPRHRREYARLSGLAAAASGRLAKDGAKGRAEQIRLGVGMFSPEVRARIKGSVWINNGCHNRRVRAGTVLSKGWRRGFVSIQT
jgi:hypothetical protein